MASEKEKAACKRKTRFKSNALALIALNKINPTRKPDKPTRVYKCPICSGWHLTSSHKI